MDNWKGILLMAIVCFGLQPMLLAQEADFPFNPLVQTIEIGESLSFHSEVLQEVRFVNVYLPVGYHPDSTATYPVVYLLDGGTDEDFIHVAGLMQFANFPWVDMMPPSILVGIQNVDRKKDFTYPSSVELDQEEFPTSGHSKEFIEFLSSELQPMIEGRYPCNGERMLIGQSIGGLLATEILYSRQELFHRYLIVSPSLWWDEAALLKREISLSSDVSVFIAVGKEGEEMEGYARSLNEALVDVASNGNQVDFLYFGKLDHANILHMAVYYGIQSFYPKADE